VLVVTFFVTSADTATLGLAMLTARGTQHPSTINRVVWGVLQGTTASVLLVLGGTRTLQNASIITGTPFALVILAGIVVMIREFGREKGRVLLQDGHDVFDPESRLVRLYRWLRR